MGVVVTQGAPGHNGCFNDQTTKTTQLKIGPAGHWSLGHWVIGSLKQVHYTTHNSHFTTHNVITQLTVLTPTLS
jgi:ribosomal protein S8E